MKYTDVPCGFTLVFMFVAMTTNYYFNLIIKKFLSVSDISVKVLSESRNLFTELKCDSFDRRARNV